MWWRLILIVLLVVGERFGAWTSAHALFATVFFFGFDEIANAIRNRTINVNFQVPIRVKHVYEEDTP